MGRYESFGKETAPKNLLIICYYLAKEKESYSWMSSEYKLSNKNQSTCFQFLEEKFGIKNIKMKLLINNFIYSELGFEFLVYF